MKLNKKQKRTATIASMAALLAVVLGMGGSTFAKYIDTYTADAQQATVAKWGFVITASSSNGAAFSKTYDSVVSATSEVVAPGTSGDVTFEVNGTAEVDAAIDFYFESYTPVYLQKAGTYYYPIVWTIGSVKTNDPATLLAEASKLTATYESETQVVSNTFTISWEWAFSSGDANDELDTILGYAAATGNATGTYEGYEYNVSLEFVVSATVTQVEA